MGAEPLKFPDNPEQEPEPEILDAGPEEVLVTSKPEEELLCHKCNQPTFKRCMTCKKPVCPGHTSNVDLSDCVDCCEEVVVNINKVSKHETEYNEWNDEITTHSYEAKNIGFSGAHWLNNSIMIASLPDTKLKSAIEYHKAMVRQLENEIVARKTQKAHQYASIPMPRRGRAPSVITGVETTKTTKVTRKRVQPKQDLIQMMQAQGLDPAKLLQMLQEKVAKNNLGIKK